MCGAVSIKARKLLIIGYDADCELQLMGMVVIKEYDDWLL